MSLSSRLPAELTLEERASEINRLFGKLSHIGAQGERVRWRIAVELHACQKLVPAGQWESWCRSNIGRSLGDIRKLLKMAEAYDPKTAHEAEISAQQVARQQQKDSIAVQRASMRALATPKQLPAKVHTEERDAGRAFVARQLIRAILAEHPITEARGMLDLVDMHDLIEALEAEAASTPGRSIRVVSTATH
jgi:hypothetical protein